MALYALVMFMSYGLPYDETDITRWLTTVPSNWEWVL